MYYFVLTHIVGTLTFLFTLWKKLREDYASNLIFSAAFSALFGVLFASLASYFWFKQYWFWLSFFAILISVIISSKRLKIKFFELIDASIAGVFPWIAMVFISDSIVSQSVVSLGGFFIIFATYLLYVFLDGRYKRFSWYTGKVGFSTLAATGVLFVVRAFAGFYELGVLSLVGRYDAILSIVVSLFSFFGIYHLSKRI